MNTKITQKTDKILPKLHKSVTKILEKRIVLGNLTQNNIAEKLGCTKSLYAKFERGQHTFSDDQIKVVQAELKIKKINDYFVRVVNKGNTRFRAKLSNEKYKISAIQKRRMKHKKCQQQMANTIGVSRQYFIQIEKGSARISEQMANSIAKELKTYTKKIFNKFDNSRIITKFVRIS